MSFLKELEGQYVINAKFGKNEFGEDGGGILFANEANLIIYCKYQFKNSADINGKKLLHIKEGCEKLTFTFEDCISLDVFLDDRIESAAESMELNVKGKPTIVWND